MKATTRLAVPCYTLVFFITKQKTCQWQWLTAPQINASTRPSAPNSADCKMWHMANLNQEHLMWCWSRKDGDSLHKYIDQLANDSYNNSSLNFVSGRGRGGGVLLQQTKAENNSLVQPTDAFHLTDSTRLYCCLVVLARETEQLLRFRLVCALSTHGADHRHWISVTASVTVWSNTHDVNLTELHKV